MNATTKTGSCLCGAVALEFQIPTLFATHCHCSMCRRSNGAGFVKVADAMLAYGVI
jgi:hypothetical protein